MGRPKGSKNKAPIHARLVAKKRARFATETVEAVAQSMPDSLGLLESVMRHFYLKAMIEQSFGEDSDWKAVDAAMETAMEAVGRWAREVALYRHARLSAVKLAGDPNAPLIPDNMTLEQLRADIVNEVARLGHVLELDAVREPQGIE